MSSIKILITGGTFDKEYDEINGRLYFKDTHLPEILNLGRSNLKVDISTLMMMDSLDMKEADRQTIVSHCAACKQNKIVITHGTDTMTETAAAIGKAALDKTIV